MEKFLKFTATALLVLFLMNIFLFIVIKLFYIKKYDQYELDYDTYLLADSHGIPLADILEIVDVYNFSEHSESYLDMERKLDFLIQKSSVKTIWLSVDDHTLSPSRESLNNLDRSVFYASKEEFSSQGEFFKEKYLEYYLPFLNPKYALVIKNFLVNELLNPSKWGGGKRVPWEKLDDLTQRRKSDERILQYFEGVNPSENLLESLKRIISKCKAHNIEIIGIRFPLTEEYLEAKGDLSYNADSLFIAQGLKVLDFDSLYLGKDDLFRDQDHLDAEGGEDFAKILKEIELKEEN